MSIRLHKSFIKNYRSLSNSLRNRFKERRDIFLEDEFNPVLNNHSLRGKYQGYRSINITGDIRVIYKKEREIVIFVTIGNHSELYR